MPSIQRHREFLERINESKRILEANGARIPIELTHSHSAFFRNMQATKEILKKYKKINGITGDDTLKSINTEDKTKLDYIEIIEDGKFKFIEV